MGIEMSIYHFQIDNQVSRKARSNIIFGPLQELDFELMEKEDYIPFLSTKINIVDKNDG
jgi:hypothetical protein